MHVLLSCQHCQALVPSYNKNACDPVPGWGANQTEFLGEALASFTVGMTQLCAVQVVWKSCRCQHAFLLQLSTGAWQMLASPGRSTHVKHLPLLLSEFIGTLVFLTHSWTHTHMRYIYTHKTHTHAHTHSHTMYYPCLLYTSDAADES